MKHILTFILILSFFASIGQVRLSDTANNGTFSYHLGSNFRGQYPKGSCYLDRDASGAFAIRRVTGAVVTPYVSMSNYELNGEVDTVFSSYIEKLNGIIMLSCGGSTPIETFAYCGAPVLDFWQQAGAGTDTLISSVGSFWSARIDETQLSLTLSESTLLYDNYPYNLGLTGGSGGCGDYQNELEVNALLCTEVLYFEATLNNQLPELIENTGCPSADITDSLHYFYNEDVNYDTLSNLKTISITSSGDTSIKSDYFIRCCGTGMLRNLGVTFQANTGIVLDTTDNTITLTAYPVKTSGTTYAASSFKIEKIEFADITAGTISGSSYNPNLGEQSNTFSLTTGKNTFKVSVEDTDGNIAYSIFQVTKTQL